MQENDERVLYCVYTSTNNAMTGGGLQGGPMLPITSVTLLTDS